MTVYFATDKIRRTVFEHKVAVKELGADSAGKLQRRYSDLLAARTVTDLVFGNPHPLRGDRKGQFALNLAGGQRMVFMPATSSTVKGDEIDWSKISEVTIIFLGDYHD
jgi:proteic killer suppression protein